MAILQNTTELTLCYWKTWITGWSPQQPPPTCRFC